jgi:subfamily B ATP-binding cassette protein HlyB/CyaB
MRSLLISLLLLIGAAHAQTVKVLVQSSPLAGFQYHEAPVLWGEMGSGEMGSGSIMANLSVLRLGGIMNAPAEPYSILPSRLREGKGKIKLDGHDIRHLSANELRHHFGVVPQETILFSGTLYENLLMANPHATFDQVVHACRMAELHEVIEQLPQGYQTEIGERGVGLSGGQKQRLAIARALLKQPKILIFDEATSSLDSQTAEHFAATINQLRGKVTMLFITHALPKGLVVDEVVRIGQIAATTMGIVEK